MKGRLIEIHVPAGGDSLPGADEYEHLSNLEQQFMEALAARKLGQFTGNEFGAGEAVWFCTSRSPVRVLEEARQLLEGSGLLAGTYAWVREDEIAGDGDLRVDLSELDALRAEIERVGTGRRKPRGRRPKVGDYYAIPLPDGRFGHARYVHHEPKWWDLVEVLAAVSPAPMNAETLADTGAMFPPIKTVVSACIQAGGWRWLGNRPPQEPFRHPVFRHSLSAFMRYKPGVYEDWSLCIGPDQWERVGLLSPEQRALEFDATWSPQSIAKRIVTGENDFDSFL